MAWTDDAIEAARQMWEAGDSAREIAETVGAVSKNAVIGKAHRLGWQQPVGNAQRSGGKRTAARMRAQKVRPAPRQPKPLETWQQIGEVVRRVFPDLLPSAPVPDNWPVTVLSVRHGECRYPLGDRWPWPFCGQPALEGTPYCRGHCAIAYVSRR